MIPDRPVHCIIYALWIGAEVSLVPVYCYPDLGKINFCVMFLCCCYSIGTDEWNGMIVIRDCMTLVSKECLAVLLCD